jgi:hypothetical protein
MSLRRRKSNEESDQKTYKENEEEAENKQKEGPGIYNFRIKAL